MMAPWYHLAPLGRALLVQTALRASYLALALPSDTGLSGWLFAHPYQSVRLVVYGPVALLVAAASLRQWPRSVAPAYLLCEFGALDSVIWTVIFAISGALIGSAVEAACVIALVAGVAISTRQAKRYSLPMPKFRSDIDSQVRKGDPEISK